MNAIKFRLLATMITLAAVTTATTVSTAQRRSTSSNRVENRQEAPARTANKSAVEKNSTFKDSDKVQRHSSSRSVNTDRQVTAPSNTKRQENRQITAPSNTKRQENRQVTAPSNAERQENRQVAAPSNSNTRQRNESVNTRSNSNRSSNGNGNGTVTRSSSNQDNQNSNSGSVRTNPGTQNSVRSKSGQNNQNQGSVRSSSTNGGNAVSSSGRRGNGTADLRTMARSTDSRTKYYHNDNDKRYSPTRDYKGSNKYWSNNYRSNKMVYNGNDNRFYRNYNPNKSSHWDRSWERYQWNQRSWVDYYHGYNPYSYRYNKYYYHDNRYGHVLRKFVYAPQIFVLNNNRYYSYDGHFFRHMRGIGYVLVDIPFGLAFDYLPSGYEQVYINGYLYFRLGNLFFENTNFGFQLVHYPERYFAYNDGFSNNGYYFDDFY